MFVNIYIFDIMKLKILFLLNRESPKFIAKLISLSIYSDLPRLVSDKIVLSIPYICIAKQTLLSGSHVLD